MRRGVVIRRVASAVAAMLCVVAADAPRAAEAAPARSTSFPVAPLIYSWWTHPVATTVGDSTYFGGVTADGTWVVARQRGDLVEARTLLQGFEPDDHNAPSILARPGRDVLVFFTRHAKSNVVYHRRAPSDTLRFGSLGAIEFPGLVTYTQVLHAGGDRVAVLTRSGCTWSYVLSEDYGLTWHAPRVLLEACAIRPYVLTTPSQSTPGLYHFAVYPHPTEPDPVERRIRYGRIDFTTGRVTSGGALLGDVFTGGGLPVLPHELEDIPLRLRDDERIRLLDVGDEHGRTVVFFARWRHSRTPFSPRYFMSARDGAGSWTSWSLGLTAGAPFWDPSTYVGGIALDRDVGSHVYVSSELSGVWRITRYTLDPSLALTQPVVLATSTRPLVRPYVPHGGDAVLYQELSKYQTFFKYRATLHSTAAATPSGPTARVIGFPLT